MGDFDTHSIHSMTTPLPVPSSYAPSPSLSVITASHFEFACDDARVTQWHVDYNDLVIGSYECFLLAHEILGGQNKIQSTTDYGRIRLALNISQPQHDLILKTLTRVMSTRMSSYPTPHSLSLGFHLHLALNFVPSDPWENYDVYRDFFCRHISLFLGGLVKLPFATLRRAIKMMGHARGGAKKAGVLGIGSNSMSSELSDDQLRLHMNRLVEVLNQSSILVRTGALDDMRAAGMQQEGFVPQSHFEPGPAEPEFEALYPLTYGAFESSPTIRKYLSEALYLSHELGLTPIPSSPALSPTPVRPLMLQIDMYLVQLQACFRGSTGELPGEESDSALAPHVEGTLKLFARLVDGFGWLPTEKLKDLCLLQACVAHFSSSRDPCYLRAALTPLPGSMPFESPCDIYLKTVKDIEDLDTAPVHQKILDSMIDNLMRDITDFHDHFNAQRASDIDLVMRLLAPAAEAQKILNRGVPSLQDRIAAAVRESARSSYIRLRSNVSEHVTVDQLKPVALRLHRLMQKDFKIYWPRFAAHCETMLEIVTEEYAQLYETDVREAFSNLMMSINAHEHWEPTGDSALSLSAQSLVTALNDTMPFLFLQDDVPFPSRAFLGRMVTLTSGLIREYSTFSTTDTTKLDSLVPGACTPKALGPSSSKSRFTRSVRRSRRAPALPTNPQLKRLGDNARGLEHLGIPQLCLRFNSLLHIEEFLRKAVENFGDRMSFTEHQNLEAPRQLDAVVEDWVWGASFTAQDDFADFNPFPEQPNPFRPKPAPAPAAPIKPEKKEPKEEILKANREMFAEFNQVARELKDFTAVLQHRIGIRIVFVDLEQPFYRALYSSDANVPGGGSIDTALSAMDTCLGTVFRHINSAHINKTVLNTLRSFLSAYVHVLLDGGNNRVFDLAGEWIGFFMDDLKEIKELFIARNEQGVALGLAEDLVNVECEEVQGVIELFSNSAERLIERYERGPHSPPFDKNTILCVLCHVVDKKAQKFLRKIVV
eukprot:c797_g1_i1.p1 GENE.c797_g1_i1~~c797_g1_i1.p1  ORF type:complete len:1124 (+),score=155.36 c797_g1_i1:392-3373(+)